MLKIIKVKLGEPAPKDSKLVKIEKSKEELSVKDLYRIGWSGHGKVPYREVEYCYYEVLANV